MDAIPGRELESDLTLLSQGSVLKGDVTFDRFTRVHGRIEGKIYGLDKSLIVIGETGMVHGEISGDEVIIDGFVHGNVRAKTRLKVSESGRLLGNVITPKFEVSFGAHFEGKATTNHSRDTNELWPQDLAANPSKA